MAAVVALGVPGIAGASTVDVRPVSGGQEVTFVAADGETNNVTIARPSADTYVVTDTGAATVTPGPGCVAVTSNEVSCTDAGIQSVRAELGDLDDTVAVTADQKLYADGGPGSDTLSGGSEPDVLDGQAGDDVINAGPFGRLDVMTGGDGHDVVSYAGRTAALRIDPNGDHDDGEPGEDDNVSPTVEEVIGGAGDDTIRGTGLDDVLRGGAGDDILDGHHGNDTLFGDAGNDRLDGHHGDDTLFGGAGNDRLDGHQGDDTVFGGAGDDILDGHYGSDTLAGGDGSDTLLARDDGGTDLVSCGAGADSATADRVDSLTGCETQDVPPAPPAPSVPDAPAGTPLVPDWLTPPSVVAVRERSVVVSPDNILSVTLGCPADQAAGCRGTVVITAPVRTRAARTAVAARRGVKARRVTLARASFNLASGKTRKLSARISRRGVKQAFGTTKVARAKQNQRVKARMTVTLRNGDGSTTSISRSLILNPPSAR